MNDVEFGELIKKLEKPSGLRGTWEIPVFTIEDYESMTERQLSQVALEMVKFTGLGSYILRPDLFDLLDYLDTRVSIREDANLEKYMHMTSSLVCLTQFQNSIAFDDMLPKRLAKHLKRIIGGDPLFTPSMETEPSLQIATFLAYPLLEGVVRRKLSRFISPDGTVLQEFEVEGRKYLVGRRISNLRHELLLLEKESSSAPLRAKLESMNKFQSFPEDIGKYRNMLLHAELTASWHSLTLLLLTYIILLEE
jgi:hypothetical protein